jgi:peroxiredoxin
MIMRFWSLSFLSLIAVFSVSMVLRADDIPSTANLGKKIANFSLTDAQGKTWSLYDAKDQKAVVIVFLSFECPVSTSYAQPLADMAAEFGKAGVAFVGLTVNPEQSDAEVAREARNYKLPFPVLRDARFKAADALKAEITPEVFLLGGDFVLRYRGRIDNGYYARLKRNQKPLNEDLRQALGEELSGRPIRVPATAAVGCAIQRTSPVRTGRLTYYRDVLPILQEHCQACHRPGEVGPFSLMTYRQAVNLSEDIKGFTQSRRMPPWKPVAGADFHNQRKLTDRELATLAAWVDAGTPAGDARDAPPPRTFPEGWQLGTPDLVLTVPEDFQVGPTGNDLFRCFVLPTNLPEDKYVAAVEIRPGNRRILHHTLLFVDRTGQGRKLEQQAQKRSAGEPGASAPGGDPHAPTPLDRGPGYSVAMGVGFAPQGGLSGWAPGQMPRVLPEGTGYYLPKGADIIMQAHYHRDGRLEKDRTSIGLFFVKQPKARMFQTAVMAGGNDGRIALPLFFAIPPGNDHFPVKGSLWASADCNLYSIMPHMHLLGKEITVTLHPPEGPARTLVAIKEWDYNWQETYWFKEPVHIKKGSRLDVLAVYDNSAKNPNNPFDPPRTVFFGEYTTNEMCFVFLGGLADEPGLRRLPLTRRNPKVAAQANAK